VHTPTSFIEAATEFCAWVEAPSGDPGPEARTALRLLVRLYADALALEPSTDVDYDLDGVRLSRADWKTVYKRFKSLPFNQYNVACDPHAELPEEPGIGDLADDLTDIYGDLNEGLSLDRSGHHGEALYSCQWSFRHHWGEHASSAIHALHTWFEKENAW